MATEGLWGRTNQNDLTSDDLKWPVPSLSTKKVTRQTDKHTERDTQIDRQTDTQTKIKRKTDKIFASF